MGVTLVRFTRRRARRFRSITRDRRREISSGPRVRSLWLRRRVCRPGARPWRRFREGFLERGELVVHAAGLERLELCLEVVWGGEHAHGLGLGFHAQHFFFHAIEGAERRRRRHTLTMSFTALFVFALAARAFNVSFLLFASAILPSSNRVFAINFSTASVCASRIRLHRLGVLRVRLASRQRLSRQVFVSLLQRQLRTLIPIFSSLIRRRILGLQLLLARHNRAVACRILIKSPCISSTVWSKIFSGSSAAVMRELAYEEMTRVNLEKRFACVTTAPLERRLELVVATHLFLLADDLARIASGRPTKADARSDVSRTRRRGRASLDLARGVNRRHRARPGASVNDDAR